MADAADHFFLSGEDLFPADDEEEEEEGEEYYDDGDDDDREIEAYLFGNLGAAPFCSFCSSSAVTVSSSSDDDDDYECGDIADYTNGSSFIPVADTLDPLPILGFGLLDPADGDMTSDYLGLGLGFDDDPQEADIDHEDGFFLRRSASRPDAAGDPPVGHEGEGLRIVGFGTDSDSEDEGIVEEADDVALPLRWDSLQIEDDASDEEGREGVVVEEFEWEDVDGRVDDRLVISMLVGANGDGSTSGSALEESDDSEVDNGDFQDLGNLDWEVLLAMNHSEVLVGGRGGILNPPTEAIQHEADPNNASDYEVLFGQFLNHISPINGSPPASRLVVENLPSVAITGEDVAKSNNLCAVCNDEMSLEEKVTRLPCSHHYHSYCIVPWLGIRNTCPVCRYELPTDNLEYENWRAQRTRAVGTTSQV